MSPFARLAAFAPLLLIACSQDVHGEWRDQSPTARVWTLDEDGSGSDVIPLPDDMKFEGALTWTEVEQDGLFDGTPGEQEPRVNVVEKCDADTLLCANELKYDIKGVALTEVLWSCWFGDDCLGCTATWDTDGGGGRLRTLTNVPLILGRVDDDGGARTDCPGF